MVLFIGKRLGSDTAASLNSERLLSWRESRNKTSAKVTGEKKKSPGLGKTMPYRSIRRGMNLLAVIWQSIGVCLRDLSG